MTTENERIAGYIKPKIYDRFIEFCEEKGISVSKGLNIIIAEYFGLQEDLDNRFIIGGVTLSEFQELKIKVNELSNAVNNLQSNIVNQSGSNLVNPIPTDTIDDSDENNDTLSVSLSGQGDIVFYFPSDRPSNHSDRENYIASETIDNQNETVYNISFDKLNDENETKDNILDETVNNNQDKSNNISSDILNTTELAKRFKVSRNAINQQKRRFNQGKISKEEYLQYTRSKDPEGKAWFFEGSDNFVE